jgi:3-dehydroquinate dehydratase II
MNYLVIQGPNLNRLGKRDPRRYGDQTLADIEADIDAAAEELGVTVAHVQSNHEGHLVDWLHERQDDLDGGIVVNPAALCLYGWSLRTALCDTGLPVAVVHISQLHAYEPVPKLDIFADMAAVYIAGAGWRGYRYALEALHAKGRP